MRLTKEITEELVREVAGEDTVKLVGLLRDKENVSEFKIAEKLRLTVNTVRNMLYRLQAHNLVTSIRKKDKKKGWYIYYWTFNSSQARSLVRIVKQRKLERFKERLQAELQQTFYVCPERCVRMKIENAMDYDFKCPECGVVLQEENNQRFIEKIQAKILELEEELAKPLAEGRAGRKSKLQDKIVKKTKINAKLNNNIKGKKKLRKSTLKTKKLKKTKKLGAKPRKSNVTELTGKVKAKKKTVVKNKAVKKKTAKKKSPKKSTTKKKVLKKKVTKKKSAKKQKAKKGVLGKVRRLFKRKK